MLHTWLFRHSTTYREWCVRRSQRRMQAALDDLTIKMGRAALSHELLAAATEDAEENQRLAREGAAVSAQINDDC